MPVDAHTPLTAPAHAGVSPSLDAPSPLPLPLRAYSGYSDAKVQENVTAEIMCVVAEEARGSYPPEIVHEVDSTCEADAAGSVDRVVGWLAQWRADNAAR